METFQKFLKVYESFQKIQEIIQNFRNVSEIYLENFRLFATILTTENNCFLF